MCNIIAITIYILYIVGYNMIVVMGDGKWQ